MTLRTTRRSLLGWAAAGALVPFAAYAHAPVLEIAKDPNCGCCTGWAEHMRAAGFDTRIDELSDLTALKSRLAIPPALASCHTAQIEGYVIEGHVPASAVRRLLAERPAATGLAVPGMPTGSPGMEVPGRADDIYNVILFGASGESIYARYQGARLLAANP